MKQKLKMTRAMRDLLNTDQKTAISAEKFEGIAVNQSIQQLLNTDQKTAISAEKFEGIAANQSIQQLMRDTCRKRLEQEHPEFDEKTVNQIVEEMDRMPQLIRDTYRKRVQLGRPQLDEATLDNIMLMMPMPPTWLVERALTERMHLPEEVRMQEVAMLMSLSICSIREDTFVHPPVV